MTEMTFRQMAGLIPVSHTTLRKYYTRLPDFPQPRIQGKTYFFKKSEVLSWCSTHNVKEIFRELMAKDWEKRKSTPWFQSRTNPSLSYAGFQFWSSAGISMNMQVRFLTGTLYLDTIG